MSIEQEIWDDFKELSEQDVYQRISYAKAKSIFGIKYEGTISRVNRIDGSQYIQNNIDKKIDAALLRKGEIKWGEIVELYPKSIPIKIPKKIVQPPVKFRTHKERRDIGEIILTNWDDNRQKLHTIFPNEEKAKEYFISKRWEEKPICPHCGWSNRIFLLKNKNQRYKCGNPDCYKKFSEKVGTIFQNSKLPLLKWYEGIYLLTSLRTHKISSPQLANALEITQLSAWKMTQKIHSKVEDEFMTKIKHGLFNPDYQ